MKKILDLITSEVKEAFAACGYDESFAKVTPVSYTHLYDTSYVRITAVDQKGTDISISEIDLLGQTGDDIDFGQTDSIGLLKEDYHAGHGESGEAVIPAGSLLFRCV